MVRRTNNQAPSTSTQLSRKRKIEKKPTKGTKLKQKSEEPVSKTKDFGIQVSADTCEIGISCDIPTDHSHMISCPNCCARENPNIVMSDIYTVQNHATK